jgi:hypothetical protein
VAALTASEASAQLSSAWMIPAVAHGAGVGDTYWRSDVSLHNPHVYELPVVVQLLPSNTVNFEVLTLDITLYPWETVNLWDALGPDFFDTLGTGAIIAYVDPLAFGCSTAEACDFLAHSRTYTLDPWGGVGEFGQTIGGRSLLEGVDWWTLGYAGGVLNDGDAFRCNFGVASWTGAWTTVRVDIQDDWGEIVATEDLTIPPYGHVQRRLGTDPAGGSLVFYLVEGPDDALVYPYLSTVDQSTGDASFAPAIASVVGASVDKSLSQGPRQPSFPAVRGERLELGPEARHRGSSQRR